MSFTWVTNSSGKTNYYWKIGPSSNPGTFRIDVKASVDEYGSVPKSISFQVIDKPTALGSSQQNSTL